MIDNLMYMMQTTTVEQLKAEIDKNTFVDKNLKDFNKQWAIDTLNKKYNDRVVFVANMSEPWYNQYQ